MKANRLGLFLFFLLGSAVFQLPAQQTETDRKLLADIRAKAEKGEAKSQTELGDTFLLSKLGVVKDEAEAVKWYRKGRRAEFRRRPRAFWLSATETAEAWPRMMWRQ